MSLPSAHQETLCDKAIDLNLCAGLLSKTMRKTSKIVMYVAYSN